MPPPPFSDGGQLESYTSSLLPGSGEQSSPMSDFTTEMDPFLTLPPRSQEPQEPSLPETGSLRQAPVHPTPQPLHQQQQQHQHQQNYYSTPRDQNSNFSAPMTTTPRPCRPRSQQMWHTPPSGEDLDHFSYGGSPTCGSGTSNSNFSPASPAGTWPSPATSFQQPADRTVKEAWTDFSISTPVSVDGCSGSSSDISPLTDSGVQEHFDVDSAEWHCEPLETTTSMPNLAGLAAVSFPASPAGLPTSTSAYMLQASMESPSDQFDIHMESSRASEPPASGAAEQQIPYAQHIYKALMQAPNHSMSLQEIYQWFQENTDKCKPGQRGWMNSIRHNLSMNAGFVKRDRKREAESMPPEVEDATANGDPKRSTEWTLTDEAITGGVQSTTRYRNKKNDRRVRDRHHHGGAANHALYHPSEHTLRHGPPANRFAPPRNREFPGRVSKAHRHGGQGLRMAPTSGFIARTSSPYYQDAFLAQAMAGQTQPLKMDPSMMALPPSSAAAGPDGYGMMIPDHQNMMHGGNGQVPSMYLGPPPPPHGPFPYDTTDVSLSYPGTEGATDANRSARLFDAAHMQDGFCEWSTGDHGY